MIIMSLVSPNLPSYFPHITPGLSSIGNLFALYYTDRFVRSFVSSIRMMGSSLAISHNGTCELAVDYFDYCSEVTLDYEITEGASSSSTTLLPRRLHARAAHGGGG